MAITLNGTTGITTPDVNSDGLTVDSTTLVVDEANNRVGIGTSSPATKFHVSGQSRVADSSNAANYMTFGVGANAPYGNASISTTTAGLSIVAEGAGNMTFLNNGSERARIDSSGNLLVGTTSVTSTSNKAGISFIDDNVNARTIVRTACNSTAATTLVDFINANGYVGNIVTSGSATAYNTSSDYRLKENVVSVTGATERLKQLNPVRFNFIADPDTTVDGFLAHEVQDVVPEAITGTKDAVDAEGNPEYQGIDQSKLVPLLTAALQEALTKIESLETRIAALEAA